MTPAERAAYARSFIGKKKARQPKKHEVGLGNMTLGQAIQRMSQSQRDAILRHPAVNTRKRP